MKLRDTNPRPDFIRIIEYPETIEWVRTRMGEVLLSSGGEVISVINSIRLPYSFEPVFRPDNRSRAHLGDYILHDGKGQFRVLTSKQFDYWYEVE